MQWQNIMSNSCTKKRQYVTTAIQKGNHKNPWQTLDSNPFSLAQQFFILTGSIAYCYLVIVVQKI